MKHATLFECLMGALLAFSTPARGEERCEEPSWFKTGSMQRDGERLVIPCHAEAASEELAEFEAKASCTARAANHVGNTVRSRDLVIVDDKSSALHREIETAACVVGLVCTPEKQLTCATGDGRYRSWWRCAFDLSKAREGERGECQGGKRQQQKELSGKNAAAASLGPLPEEPKVLLPDADSVRAVTIISVPHCDEILISGPRARIETCHEQPMRLLIRESDKEIIIRAKGYVPKVLTPADKEVYRVLLQTSR